MKNTLAKVVLAAFMPVITLSVVQAAVPSTATQNVPGKMNYQGYLRDPSTGSAYADGIYTLDCRIYDSDTGGTCLWGGRYSAYVKDGYFNIMLGDENSTQNLDVMTGITYTGAANLWKALWGADATDNARYLGVTPLQDAGNATISSPTEILPRQQLLTSPFAFRAQSAQYASEAKENFTVGGNLTVNGTTTFSGTINAQSGTQSVGPIRASSTSVNLGNGYTSATASNVSSLPTYIYGVSKYINLYSYYSMNFKPTAGNINFTVPSGYDMKVTGSGDFISDVPVNTIGGSGATTIKGNSTTVKGSGNHQVMVNGYGVFGKGPFSWLASSAAQYQKPFQMKKITLNFTSGQSYAVAEIQRNNDYSWFIGGHSTSHRVLLNNNIYLMKAYYRSDDGIWRVRVDVANSVSSDGQMEVVVIGINNDMVQNAL